VQHPIPPIWANIILAATAFIFVALFLGTRTAKTSGAIAIYYLLLIGVSLVAWPLFMALGLGPSPEELQKFQNQALKPEEIINALPWEFFVAGAIWIIGGNYILIRQRRKAGQSWKQVLNPFAPFVRHMDRWSYLQLLLMVLLSLAVANAGLGRVGQLPPESTPTTQSFAPMFFQVR
jgi:hypothetical protein